MDSIKCVVVGDWTSGKSSMLTTYVTNEFPTKYTPTVFENYTVKGMVENEPCTIELFDTCGLEDYDRLRPLSYHETDVFLVCFSVTDVKSIENVKEKWVPEITHYCKGIPFLLVGTKIDLRDDIAIVEKLTRQDLWPVSKEEGEKLAYELNAAKYVECSAFTKEGLKEVFDEAIKIALEFDNPQKSEVGIKKKKRKEKCVIS